jgi:hypothetical protein
MATLSAAANADSSPEFLVKDCALIAMATGIKAYLLQEFREKLRSVDAASIYHHFWGGLLQARFEEREYNNDFASWIRHGIHDAVLAERLAALDPTQYPDLEGLRQQILELIDARMDEVEYLAWTRASVQFEFICSQIVVFDTDVRLAQPEQLADSLPGLSTSSIFYHFIDARRRNREHRDDFTVWLSAFGDQYSTLRKHITGIDPYFNSLSELRQQLADVFCTQLPAGTGP